MEGVLIIVAAIAIVQHAWQTWWNPAPLAAPWQGLALNGLATVLNALWGTVLLRAGRQNRSVTLTADGRHLWADVVTSVALLTGLELALQTGRPEVDPLLAAAIAVYVLWSGTSLIGSSVSGLMDAAPPADVVDRIRRLVGEHAEGALEVHDLRTRHAGRLTYLEFHLVVPGDMRVSEAHDICDRIEAALRGEMQHLTTTIHVEPEGKAKHHGVLVL